MLSDSMLRLYVLLLISVILVGCGGRPETQPEGQSTAELKDKRTTELEDKPKAKEFDRSTPSATYMLVHEGFENDLLHQAMSSMTEQRKLGVLFNLFGRCSMAVGDEKEKLKKVFSRYDLDLDTIDQRLGSEASLLGVRQKIGDLESFVLEVQEASRPPATQPTSVEILDVSIEGDRATLTYEREIFGMRKGVPTDDPPIVVTERAFLRKYDDDWLVCTEGEWKN